MLFAKLHLLFLVSILLHHESVAQVTGKGAYCMHACLLHGCNYWMLGEGDI